MMTTGSAGSARPDSVRPAVFVLSWVFFSNLTILFNKFLIDTVGFRFPVILTCWHMMFATAATQVLARTTSLLDSRRAAQMTQRTYLRAVVPIGVMYSASMVCSTLVYLYLSVPFIQMLKASAPAVVLLVGWLWGVEHPTIRKTFNIAWIVVGVVVASAGEIHFSWAGFLYQLGGLLFESLRVIMIQALFTSTTNADENDSPAKAKDDRATTTVDTRGEDERNAAAARGRSRPGTTQLHKMDPLVGLYYYAPVCAVTNLIMSVLWEGQLFHWQDVVDAGPGLLFLNALAAFLLNVSSVLLIGKTSGLVLVLTGILKNILLVAFAVIFTGENITAIQILGYTAALLGLVVYQTSLEDLQRLAAVSASSIRSVAGGGGGVGGGVVARARSWRRRGSRRLLIVVVAGCIPMACLVYTTLVWQHGRQELAAADLAESWSLASWLPSFFWTRSENAQLGSTDSTGSTTGWLPSWLHHGSSFRSD